VDDRTERERGGEEETDEWSSENDIENKSGSGSSISQEFDPELVAGGVKRLFKSRYSSVSRFIGKTESDEEQRNIDALNDLDANMDEEAFQILLDGGLDRSLASHIAHLFVRDPLVIFDDAIDLDNETAMVSQLSAGTNNE
jgi:Glutamate-cysteine ligase